MAVDLNQLLQRCADLEVAALSSIGKTASAKPFFIWQQGTFPYFTNRIRGEPMVGDSEQFDLPVYNVVMRLVIGHITEGVPGQPETVLYDYIPVVLDYFSERAILMDDTYTAEILYLKEALMTETPSFAIFRNDGIGAQQVGCEFNLRCVFEQDNFQIYD